MDVRKILLISCLGLVAGNVLAEENNYKITEKPVTLKFLGIQAGAVFDENYPVFKEAFKDTNVKLESAISKNSTDINQAFNLAVASGDLPDIISYGQTDKLEALGMDGGLVPLNGLIEKYAPNIKAFFEKYPRYRKDAVSADGNIYFIPDYYDWYNLRASQGLYIRKDWLDKLGLEVPKTMEELYNVLKAFKTQDPNGNGLADEIPYFDRIASTVDKELLGFFGAQTGFYADENGKVYFGPTKPIFKEAMKEVIKWYKEGLIDPEIFTRGFQSRDYALRNNLGGATFDWFASTSSYNNDPSIKEKNPEFEFIVIEPPMYNGKQYAPDARPTFEGGWAIGATTEDHVVVMKYFDYWFSEKGFTISNWGLEGDTFVYDENGEKVFTDKVMNNPGKTPLQVLRDEGAQFAMGTLQDYKYEKGMSDPEAMKWAELYTQKGYIVDPFPTLKYTQEEQKKIQRIKPHIERIVEEMSQKWILGAEDFDSTYDTFIENLNKAGLQELLEINQKAYDRFMAS